ncbi:MAG: trans-aconitate 2-methyltransferase [Comamonadaceae bacterium]|nr:trans-aconitate 2-methyltransferase [Burkholderiales bacterium]MEB2349392.1 trans-aconitate 2-methyltransferase [Comamonadaceae bacterium]
MQDWDPALYLRFADARTRPAAELLARVPLREARRAVDLGCGTGNSTALLAQRYPGARVTGIDSSQAMLARAREQLPSVDFALADMATWEPSADAHPDLIFANASLQWAINHEALLVRLFACLAPGGALAVQMPDNLNEPVHRLAREVAALPQYADSIEEGAEHARSALLPAAGYYDLLAAPGRGAAAVDVWRTVYQQPMASPAAIVQWLRGAGIKPYVDVLPAALQREFLAEYERRIDAAYPPRADGTRLLAFPRIFIVALRTP